MERRNSANRNSKGELSTEVESSLCASQAPGRGQILLHYILKREYLFFYVSDWLKSDRLQQNWILNVHLLKTRDRRCWSP